MVLPIVAATLTLIMLVHVFCQNKANGWWTCLQEVSCALAFATFLSTCAFFLAGMGSSEAVAREKNPQPLTFVAPGAYVVQGKNDGKECISYALKEDASKAKDYLNMKTKVIEEKRNDAYIAVLEEKNVPRASMKWFVPEFFCRSRYSDMGCIIHVPIGSNKFHAIATNIQR